MANETTMSSLVSWTENWSTELSFSFFWWLSEVYTTFDSLDIIVGQSSRVISMPSTICTRKNQQTDDLFPFSILNSFTISSKNKKQFWFVCADWMRDVAKRKWFYLCLKRTSQTNLCLLDRTTILIAFEKTIDEGKQMGQNCLKLSFVNEMQEKMEWLVFFVWLLSRLYFLLSKMLEWICLGSFYGKLLHAIKDIKMYYYWDDRFSSLHIDGIFRSEFLEIRLVFSEASMGTSLRSIFLNSKAVVLFVLSKWSFFLFYFNRNSIRKDV